MSDQQRRRYDPVVPKEFRSTIPGHLLGRLSETERYLVETMSKLENQYEWLMVVAIANNKNIIDLGGRADEVEAWKLAVEMETKGQSEKVEKLWDWKQMMSGKWAVVWAAGLILISVLLKFLLDHLVKKGP
jgi:hypothetical protein